MADFWNYKGRWPSAAMLFLRAAKVVSAQARCVAYSGPLATTALFTSLALAALYPLAAEANQFVKLDYNLTLMDRSRDTAFIELFDDRPLTRDNFMQYVNAGLYDGTFMHRLVPNFVLQGGGFYPQFLSEPAPLNVSLDPSAAVDLDGNSATSNPTVNNEFNNSPTRSNTVGTLAMAKVGPATGQPPTPQTINSATNQWFVNLKNNAGPAPDGLDFQNGGFTVFGEVRGDGMNLFNAYATVSTQNLNPDFDNNLVRDSIYPFAAVPTLSNGAGGFHLMILEKANRVDYYGDTGSSTTMNFPVGGLTISTRDTFIDKGTTFTGTGGLTIAAGRTLGVRENITLNRTVTNLGRLEPGLSNGLLTVSNYVQGAGGTLAVDIRGTTVNTHYDRLTANGTAQLNGKLEATLLNSYQPLPGNAFNVVAANTITGSFSSYVLPDLDRFLWNVIQNQTAVVLTVIAGDYNNNGTVDAADYVVWRNSLGTAFETAYSGADGNGDKIVSNADYNVWKSNFGKSDLAYTSAGGVGSAVAVPEPMTLALWGLAVLLLASSVRRPIKR